METEVLPDGCIKVCGEEDGLRVFFVSSFHLVDQKSNEADGARDGRKVLR